LKIYFTIFFIYLAYFRYVEFSLCKQRTSSIWYISPIFLASLGYIQDRRRVLLRQGWTLKLMGWNFTVPFKIRIVTQSFSTAHSPYIFFFSSSSTLTTPNKRIRRLEHLDYSLDTWHAWKKILWTNINCRAFPIRGNRLQVTVERQDDGLISWPVLLTSKRERVAP